MLDDDHSVVDLFSLIVGVGADVAPAVPIADAAPGLPLVVAPAVRVDGYRKTVHAGTTTPSIWYGQTRSTQSGAGEKETLNIKLWGKVVGSED